MKIHPREIQVEMIEEPTWKAHGKSLIVGATIHFKIWRFTFPLYLERASLLALRRQLETVLRRMHS